MTCAVCADREEYVAWLERELGLSVASSKVQDVVSGLGVTPQCARLLLALHAAKGRVLSKAQCLAVTYRGFDGEDDRGDKIVDVWVCNIRKVAGRDAIETCRNRGYRLSAAMADRISALCH